MIRRGMAGFLVALVVLAALPMVRDTLGFSVFYLVLLSTVLFWIGQATSWNVLSGYSGYFSFGQGAFVGLGAYATAVLSGRHGVEFFVTLPVAGGLAVVLAVAVGALAFRLRSFRGEIFALLTLAVPFILAALARINSAIDGGQGIVVRVPAFPDWLGQFQDFLYLLNLAVATAAVALGFAIQHSRLGWALTSIRDDEDVAEGLGVGTFRYKMLAISASGLIGGVAGGIFALQIGFVTVESVFGLTIPLFVIVMSVLGGRTHWLGPVIGAAVVVTLQDRLSAAGFEGWRLVILGAVLAVLVVVAPEGLQSRLRGRPRAALLAFAAPVAALAVLRVWGGVLDWIVAGMVCAAAAALWPSAAGRGARAPRPEPQEPGVRQPATVAPATVAPATVAPATVAPAAIPPAAAGNGGGVLVECRDVARYFGGVRALQGLTLEIREGELVGLVGPNGSGKTTLINLLAGTLRPTGGTIRVAGRDIVGLPPHRVAHAGMSRTYQIPRPFESMTVRDNVAIAIMFGLQPRPLQDARRAAERHLEFVGLRHLAGAYPTAINLHQRQLLEMARAVATGPKVLLLDEAMAGLNPAEIDNAVRVVRRIHESGVTIVVVEHLLRVVNQLATRIVVLDRGSCLADGDPRAVMRDPEVVRAYLGKHAHA
jgi:branched-chain amino acid transport system permease protein